MAGTKRQWLVVETCSGRSLVTEKHLDGTVIWKVQPVPSHCHGRAVRSCECHGVKLRDLKSFCEAAQMADISGQRYAEEVFALAQREPPDANGEPPVTRSHEDGARIEFSIERFRHFDRSKISVESVEPVDSQYKRFGGRCLLLRNVLTADECSYLMREMERDLTPVRYRHDYRNNDRCIFNSPELAELLYQRIQPFAKDMAVQVDIEFLRQHLVAEEPGDCPEELRLGLGMEGTWQPLGLNECLRFCKYNAGGFFRKHCDAIFKRSEDEQSLFTCMFYLNGDLDGGATRFLHFDRLLDGEALELASQGDVLASVPPEAGLCMLFFQKGLLHEGEDLLSGAKYILRTDLMFRRDPKSKPKRTAQEEEAMGLLRRAQEAEEKGGKESLDLAAQLYRRAFKLDGRLERMI